MLTPQNEHICATAVYCYDAENVTEQSFSFRQRYNFEAKFEATEAFTTLDWTEYLAVVFPCLAGADVSGSDIITQVLGTVAVPLGRLLTFPNVFQQRRSGLCLVDKSKPGHCKTLFLYLVDPHIRIISTANVPPLRDDWCENRAALVRRLLCSRLPAEMAANVEGYSKDELDPPITMTEAQQHRGEMISTRRRLTGLHNELFEDGTLPGL